MFFQPEIEMSQCFFCLFFCPCIASQWAAMFLAPNVLQNIFSYVPRKNERHADLE